MSSKKLYSASEAAEYLRQKWQMKSFSVNAFRQHRHRHKIKPTVSLSNATLWSQEDLDKIPQPIQRETGEENDEEEPESQLDSRAFSCYA